CGRPKASSSILSVSQGAGNAPAMYTDREPLPDIPTYTRDILWVLSIYPPDTVSQLTSKFYEYFSLEKLPQLFRLQRRHVGHTSQRPPALPEVADFFGGKQLRV